MDKEKKDRLQMQLRQFLKDYRNINNLSAEEAAQNLSVEIATYRVLEGNKTNNRVISSLEYLESIASLNSLSLTDFITFLERNRRTESGSNKLKRDLYIWEVKLLDVFDKVGIALRDDFINKISLKSGNDLRESIYCLTSLLSLHIDLRASIYGLVFKMKQFIKE